MKTRVFKQLNSVALALLSFAFGACSLFDKGDDINFDSTIEETITVLEADGGENVAYNKTIVLDAAKDPDVDKYKNKISGFTVKSISYQVISFTGQPSTFSGTFSFGDVSASTPTVAATISNLNLQQAFQSGQVFNLAFSPADIDKIAGLLKDDKAVKLFLTGTLSSAPVTSNILVTMEVSVKADAL